MHGISCSSVAGAWLCQHSGMLLYLVPSMAMAVLMHILSRASPAFFIFLASGTICHELAHFFVGLVTNAQPVGLTIIPKRNGNTWRLGEVRLNNLRWYNAAPAALAPLGLLAIPIAVAWYRTRFASWHFAPLDVGLTFLLGPLFLSFWPSPVDWKLALRSWPYLLVIACGAGAYAWLKHPGFHL
ncbi:hypothetical protein E4L96_08015 [Massilia arenosa]|uniref:M50 family peptidase n=2 Tax=Zemynaea arenosa TaxID=2561931 RepID=A0A4Y9SFP3_9BURK|nr:hypothetical protein E4L96_08015 [Massilia arenosa]